MVFILVSELMQKFPPQNNLFLILNKLTFSNGGTSKNVKKVCCTLAFLYIPHYLLMCWPSGHMNALKNALV